MSTVCVNQCKGQHEGKRKALVFLSPHDPTNVRNWSGTLHALYRALERSGSGITVHRIDGGWVNAAAQQFNRVLLFIGLKFNCRYTKLYAICAGLYVSARLLFAPKGPIVAVIASSYVAYLFTRRRIIYISDATFRSSAEIYPDLRALPRWLYQQFDDNEARTLRKASAIIYPSKWASESAKVDYGIDPEKIVELPFGANIPDELIKEYCAPKSSAAEKTALLFVSADWNRKGGDKAIEICRALLARGHQARLVVIGHAPDEVRRLDFVDARGFLDKSDPAQLAEICRAYRDAHFFVLPTRADASPIVFSECRAFGVPPVAHDVGGIASAITHGQTGLLLPIDATADQFSQALLPYLRDDTLYTQLSRDCRKWYVDQAHWNNWSDLILRLADLKDGAGQSNNAKSRSAPH